MPDNNLSSELQHTVAPILKQTYFTEKEGVHAVASLLLQMRAVLRETTNADVGVDGHIERFDDSGRATGHIIAAQLKSGESYLRFTH